MSNTVSFVSNSSSSPVMPAGESQNLGISYSAGTGVFAVTGSSAALSSGNPAYVSIPSKSSPGLTNTLRKAN